MDELQINFRSIKLKMQKNVADPLTQFSVCGCALWYICLCPTVVLLALTIYYSVAFNSYIPTTCMVTSDPQRTTIKTCGYYGCYFINYYYYDVAFATEEKNLVETRTEYVLNHYLNSNDTFVCYYQSISPQSGVSFENHFRSPFLACLILTCMIGGIPFICCLLSIIVFPFALLIERKNVQEIQGTNQKNQTNPIPENK